jgi:hypothetical protein
MATKNDGLDPHPISELFPPMSDSELDELREDIKNNGLIHPIVTFEDKILDGRHRYKCCQALGLEPRLELYRGKDPISYVISVNLKRRHLDTSQRSMVAAKLVTTNWGGDRKASKQDQGAKMRLDISVEKAAETMNVSERSVDKATAVLKSSKKLANEVAVGSKSLNAALEEARAKNKAKEQQNEPMYDKDGWEIPFKIQETWLRAADKAKTAMTAISKMRSLLRDDGEQKDPVYREFRFQENILRLDAIYDAYKLNVLPNIVCTSCQGKVPDSCTFCKGRGFISDQQAFFVPAEVKELRKKALALKKSQGKK